MLNKLSTELRCRNFVNKHRLSTQSGTECAKTCVQRVVYIPTALPFCIPPLAVGLKKDPEKCLGFSRVTFLIPGGHSEQTLVQLYYYNTCKCRSTWQLQTTILVSWTRFLRLLLLLLLLLLLWGIMNNYTSWKRSVSWRQAINTKRRELFSSFFLPQSCTCSRIAVVVATEKNTFNYPFIFCFFPPSQLTPSFLLAWLWIPPPPSPSPPSPPPFFLIWNPPSRVLRGREKEPWPNTLVAEEREREKNIEIDHSWS